MICLVAIIVQDYTHFAISWGWLPIIAGIGIYMGLQVLSPRLLLADYLFSIFFIGMQFFVMTLWYSLKSKKWVNVSKEMIGWGDILFFLVIVFSFSFSHYLLFFVFSLLLVALVYGIKQKINPQTEKRIPLAGALAGLFLVVKAGYYLGWIPNIYSNYLLW